MRVFDSAKYHLAQMGPGATTAQAYVHGGLLFVWLARRGLLEAEVLPDIDAALSAGRSVGEVYAELADGLLSEEVVTPTGAAFLLHYVQGAFLDDLRALESDTGGPWSTPGDAGSIERFTAVFDKRLAAWREGLPAPEPTVEVVLLGIPYPWPPWRMVVAWRPDDEAQQAAAARVRVGRVGFVPTAAPAVLTPAVGRIGAFAEVQAAADDGSWLRICLPRIDRFRVVGREGESARVVALADPVVPRTPEVNALLAALDPRVGPEVRAGDVADRVGYTKARTAEELRELLEAVDPMARVQLALRLARVR